MGIAELDEQEGLGHGCAIRYASVWGARSDAARVPAGRHRGGRWRGWRCGGVGARSGRLRTARAAVPLGTQPPGLPPRQHAWENHQARDADGNPLAPRFNRLLLFDVAGNPTPAHARLLEAALRTLERTYSWVHRGLLFTVGWSPGYFERALGVRTPIPYAQALSDFEQPAIDGHDVCLHLACDDEGRLAAVEAALIHGARCPEPTVRSISPPRRCSWGSSRACVVTGPPRTT
jgi:hypothetical protein